MLQYVNVSKNDLPELIDLYEQYLNGGEPIKEHLRTGLSDPGYIGVKCVDQGRILGVFSAGPGIQFTYPHEELEQAIAQQWGNTKIYSGDMLVVLKQYRGHGMARALTKAFHAALKESGVENLVVEMWNPRMQGDLPAAGIMKYIGDFQVKWNCPAFYQDLYRYGMTCPNCGDGPCCCGAVVGVIAV